jgi:hypothetical protein
VWDDPLEPRVPSLVCASELSDFDDAPTQARASYPDPFETPGADDEALTRSPLASKVELAGEWEEETVTSCPLVPRAPSRPVETRLEGRGPMDLDELRRSLFDEDEDEDDDYAGDLEPMSPPAVSGPRPRTSTLLPPRDPARDVHESARIPMRPRVATPAESLRPRLAEIRRVMEERVSMLDSAEIAPIQRPMPAGRRTWASEPPPTTRGLGPLPPPPATPRGLGGPVPNATPRGGFGLEPPCPGAAGAFPHPTTPRAHMLDTGSHAMPPASYRHPAPTRVVAQRPQPLNLNVLGIVLTGLAALAVVVCALVLLRSEERRSRSRDAVPPTPVLVASAPEALPAPTAILIAPPDVPSAPPPPPPVMAARAPAPPPRPALAPRLPDPRISAKTGKAKSVDEILAELGQEQLKR